MLQVGSSNSILPLFHPQNKNTFFAILKTWTKHTNPINQHPMGTKETLKHKNTSPPIHDLPLTHPSPRLRSSSSSMADCGATPLMATARGPERWGSKAAEPLALRATKEVEVSFSKQ